METYSYGDVITLVGMLVNMYAMISNLKGATAVHKKCFRHLKSTVISLFTLLPGVFESPYLFLSDIFKDTRDCTLSFIQN